ncbi:MAG: hypothetical protein JNG86_12695, partial [Verrucomicrobiaceae bacterium]|nr:hypothetical protein [Verrucomicrobiaceae bacterium]
MKRLLLVLAALGAVVATLLKAAETEEGGRPAHFGVKDGSLPQDPRDFRRGGHGNEYPTWPVSKELPNDVFTFARIRYTSSYGGRNWGRRGGGQWSTDYPDSDLNMS